MGACKNKGALMSNVTRQDKKFAEEKNPSAIILPAGRPRVKEQRLTPLFTCGRNFLKGGSEKWHA